jgi:hypothetical protein
MTIKKKTLGQAIDDIIAALSKIDDKVRASAIAAACAHLGLSEAATEALSPGMPIGVPVLATTPPVVPSRPTDSRLLRRRRLFKYVKGIATMVIAMANLVLIYYTVQSNTRAAQAFVAENRPLLDITPIAIAQNFDGIHASTEISISNFSGFSAHEVGVDLKYGENSWINEWIKADEDAKKKRNDSDVVKSVWYQSTPQPIIKKLEPGETQTTKKLGLFMSGSLNLEEVVAKGKEGLTVSIRVTWQNEKGHVFDAVHDYRLIGTVSSAKGRSFTFIPKGLVSQKETVRN